MSNHDDKKYDVAISLRWTDVEHARTLYELLHDRLEVFFAEEKQEDFVGTDGEESFGYIFRDHARVVVVLYRPDWGSTPFTRAEEAAIKQRAWSEGYGFSIWVPMNEEKSVPPYLPPQYVWLDFDQYGVTGLASVVEERVRESGREVRPETTEDRLLRIKRRIELERKRRDYEWSQEGFDFVSDAYKRLENVVEARLGQYEAISTDIPFRLKRDRDRLIVTSFPFRCVLHVERYAQNTIRGAYLAAYLHEDVNGYPSEEDWKERGEFVFEPTLDDSGDPAWALESHGYFSTEEAVAFILDDLAERVYLAYEKRIANDR